MRITGQGIWGEPADRAECIRVLRRAIELGVNFIDTADSYGPGSSAERYAEEQGIGFIPWFPIAAGDLAKPGGPVDDVVRATGASPGQVALAWLLAKSPVMLPIPGTSKVAHLEENVAAAGVRLTDEQLA